MRQAILIIVTLFVCLAACSPETGKAREGSESSSVERLTAEAPGLTLAGARMAIASAVEEAKRRGTTGAIAVADAAGHLIAFRRVDGTFVAADAVSAGKARTAALFRKPTRVFEEIIVQGRTPMLNIDRFTPMQGGVPIVIDGQVVGAVGVSGASTAQEDEELALVAAKAVAEAEIDEKAIADPTVPRAAKAAARRKSEDLRFVSGSTLTSAGARAALAGALAKARALETTGTIAVADRTGHLVLLDRIDGTFIAGDDVSAGKARTAALFRKPTRVFEDIIRQGRTPMLKIEGFTPMQGGVPIVVEGEVVGAIGVSGAASAPQDEELALAGAAVFAGEPPSGD